MTTDLAELSARSEIWSLLNRYARGADRCDWPLVRSCYHDDAHDDHGLYRGGVDGLMDFLIHTAAHFESTSHQLTNHLAEVDGNTARCETGCLCWYRRIDRQGHERVIAQGLRYLDTLACRGGRWAIATRVVVLDWEQVLQTQASSPINAAGSAVAAVMQTLLPASSCPWPRLQTASPLPFHSLLTRRPHDPLIV